MPITELEQLAGKTITKAQQMKLKEYDDRGFLRLDFSDGTHCTLEGGYGGYTGKSEDEYITLVSLADAEREAALVEFTNESA